MSGNSAPALTDPDWYRRLVGVRSSKTTYYPEYRHTADSRDRSIRALEPVSRALTTLEGGPERLVEAVVSAAAEIFSADGVACLISHPAFGERPYLLLAAAEGGSGVIPPPELAAVVNAHVGHDVGGGVVHRLLLTALVWNDRSVGWLAVRLPAGRVPDETDEAILRTLANQTVVAIQNSWLYTDAERSRAEAMRAYDEMALHVRDLETRNRQLHEARSALAEAREREAVAEERQRIARELHDHVAQHVLSIGMNIEWCRGVTADPEVVDRLMLAKELARSTVDYIRRAIFELSAVGDPVSRGLPFALRHLVTDEFGLGASAVTVRVVGRSVRLPEAVERALYMIAREAVFNAFQHAAAQGVTMRLSYCPGSVRLSVTDDGYGDAQALRRHLQDAGQWLADGFHCGLVNMAARARELGGELSITRAPGHGIRIRVWVPTQKVA
ncbi:MAG: sensor histidine kinase [Propionibacteriales bacterium]|nr:sensor histidine kinase [Propionibacteriales bacterium]